MIPDNVTLICADTETTSAEPDRGVCEVGWVFVHPNGEIYGSHESLIDPEKPISPAASGVHGLTYEDVQDAPTLAEFFSSDTPGCYGKKLQGPLVVIGQRISFDTHTLAQFVEGDLYELCTLRWIRRLYPEMDNHQLSTAMFALNLPRPAGAHRVMSDIHCALNLALHIAQRMDTDLVGLARMSQEPFEIVRFPFGAHKGKLFSEVPKSYLRWARENMKDLDQDMRFTIDKHLSKRAA